jgi:hypothetical protein
MATDESCVVSPADLLVLPRSRDSQHPPTLCEALGRYTRANDGSGASVRYTSRYVSSRVLCDFIDP